MPYKRNVKRVVLKRKLRSKKPNKVTPAVKSYVSRVLSRSEETKFSTTQYGLTLFNGGINSSADIIAILPTIAVGTGQNDRIGNKIRPVRMEITGYVCYYTAAIGSYSDAKMLGARLFCYQDKTVRSYANSSILNYNLLNLGGTSSNFNGSALNYIAPHNNEQFTFFCDKKMVVMKPYGLSNNTTPSATNALTSMDRTMFHPFKLVFTKKQLPAVLQYDQGDNLSYPTNFAPFISLGYADLMNTSPDTVNTQLAMEFSCTLYYKDS